jgi:threonine/homoserine/homoserine lactone efflux protein
MLGIGAGVMVHVIAAAVGLSAILATSATAFLVVKYVGAAYIIWMAIGLFRSKTGGEAKVVAAPALPYSKIFAQGFLTNVLNPKQGAGLHYPGLHLQPERHVVV